MREPGNNLQFKFRYVDEDGNEAGFFATKGALNDNGLLLGEDLIVIEQILVVQTHRKFISIVCLTESEAVTITINNLT